MHNSGDIILRPTINDTAEPEHIDDVVINDENITQIITAYRSLPPEITQQNRTFLSSKEYENLPKPELTPLQIDIVLQYIIKIADQQKIEHELTGGDLSDLLKKSYRAGHNDFLLHTKDAHLNYLSAVGRKNTPFVLTIDGNIGDDCFQEARYVALTVHGIIGNQCLRDADHSTLLAHGDTGNYLAENTKYTSIEIRGSVGHGCCEKASHAKAIIHANAGFWLGKGSSDSAYVVDGSVGFSTGSKSTRSSYHIGKDAENNFASKSDDCFFHIEGEIRLSSGKEMQDCTFVTANEKTYELLRKTVSSTNTVALIKR